MDPEPKIKNLPLAVWPDWTPKILAYMTTVGVFSIIAALFFVPIPEGNMQPIVMMLGQAVGAWLLIMKYFYDQTAANVSRDAVKANTEAQVSTSQKVVTTTEANPLEVGKP